MSAAGALLAAAADVNARNHKGWTPLHSAARARGADTTLLRQLLQAGADVDARTPLGETPLHLATSGQRHRYYWQDRAQVVTALLEAGAEVDARTNDGRTPLHVALQADRPAAAMKLLEAGADPGARDGAGNLADPGRLRALGYGDLFRRRRRRCCGQLPRRGRGPRIPRPERRTATGRRSCMWLRSMPGIPR